MIIEIVNLTLVDQVWPHILPWVAKAHKRCEAEITPGELWQGCRSGNLFLVVGYDEGKILVSAVVRFETGHKGLVLNIMYLGGEGFSKWGGDIVAHLKEMAKENGAVGLTTQGSPAWGRLLKNVRTVRRVYYMEVA